jgi:hypothetical protein
MRTSLFALLILTVSATCFAGIEEATIQSTLKGEYAVGVVVKDERESLRNGDAEPVTMGKYVGGMFLSRNHIYTDSGRPVVTEMADGLVRHFLKTGRAAALLPIANTDELPQIQKALKSAGLKRTIVLALHEFWLACYRGKSCEYQLQMTVFDESGAKLAEAKREGEMDTAKTYAAAGTDAFGVLASQLLADAKIVGALAVTP